MTKFSKKTCLSYAATDMAGQLLFCMVSFYLLKFYTDVVGISISVAGTVMLLVRLVDVFDTPFWGIMIDRTNSRWGKCRPWFLWLAFPFSIMGVLIFAIPDLGSGGKIAWATISLILFSVSYAGLNTSTTAVLSSLTEDPQRRMKLTCWRMLGSKVGVLCVNATAIPLVAWFGKGNDAKGFFIAMVIFAVISLTLNLVAFQNLRERGEVQRSFSTRKGFEAIRGNWPWFIIFGSSLLFWVAFVARISMIPYFCQYVLLEPRLIPIANSLDFLSLASILFIPWLCTRRSKSHIWAIALLGSVGAQGVILLGVKMNNFSLISSGWILGILFSGVALTLPFSLIAESVEYGEWKSGIRATGLLTAIGVGCCVKAGSGLGAALPAWILGASGYIPNVAQAPSALRGIEVAFVWIPALFYTLALLPVLFYRRFERMEEQVKADLSERR